MNPIEAEIQTLMLETTLRASKLLNRLLEKQSLSAEETNAADVALRFLQLTAQAGKPY
jgi:hypothetical protein